MKEKEPQKSRPVDLNSIKSLLHNDFISNSKAERVASREASLTVNSMRRFLLHNFNPFPPNSQNPFIRKNGYSPRNMNYSITEDGIRLIMESGNFDEFIAKAQIYKLKETKLASPVQKYMLGEKRFGAFKNAISRIIV